MIITLVSIQATLNIILIILILLYFFLICYFRLHNDIDHGITITLLFNI